jgi:hypothetical protein
MAAKFRSTLTNYAFEIQPATVDQTAMFLAPEVVTGIYTGYYKTFGDAQSYQAPDTRRGIGMAARRLSFDVQDAKFNLDPNALDVAIDDTERKQAAQLDPQLLERQKIKFLVKNGNNSHSKRVVDLAKSVSYTSAYAIDCTNATVSPTTPIDQAIEAMGNYTGQMPNRLLISLGALNAIRNHPKVITRLQGVSIAGVTIDMIRSMLLNPNIEILVSTLVLSPVGLGASFQAASAAASSNVNYVGYDVFLFYCDPNPTPYDMSFMKTFRMDSRGISAVYEERDPFSRSDVYMLDWHEQVLLTGPSLGMRLQVTPGTGF